MLWKRSKFLLMLGVLGLSSSASLSASDIERIARSLGLDMDPVVIKQQEPLSGKFRAEFQTRGDLRADRVFNYFAARPFEVMAFRHYIQMLYERSYLEYSGASELVTAAFEGSANYDPSKSRDERGSTILPVPVAILPHSSLPNDSVSLKSNTEQGSRVIDFGESEQAAFEKQAESERIVAVRELEEHERRAKNIALAAALIEEFSKAPDPTVAIQEKVARAVAAAAETETQAASDQLLSNAQVSITSTDDDTEVDLRGLLAYDEGGVKDTFAFNEFGYSNADENETLNIGFGVRKIDRSGKVMIGANVFYDRELNRNHQRASVGVEALTTPLQVSANRYFALSGERTVDGSLTEKPLSGHDVEARVALPFFPGLFASYNQSTWYTETTPNIQRNRYTLGGNLSNHLSLELSHNDYSRAVEDDQKATLSYNYAFGSDSERPTLFTPSAYAYEFNPISDNDRYKMVDRENNIITEVADSAALTVTFRAL